jgi:pimeloyl-ACP methyl ester carboxylesterase
VQWLDDVMTGLSIEQAAFAGTSLGGWLALDYAIRRPERVSKLAVLCPAGIGRQKIAIVFQTLALRLLGSWGRERTKRKILGKSSQASPAARAFTGFIALIHEYFRPRFTKIPVFSDASLSGLRVPVLAVVGGKDVLIDSRQTQQRLNKLVPGAEVRFLPDAGHAITGQGGAILSFLRS